MLINSNLFYLHLLIFALLINVINCNWLRIGSSETNLPHQDYILQFKHQKNQFKKMHTSNLATTAHQHRLNQKNTIAKLLNQSKNDQDVFVNDFISTRLNKIESNQEYDQILNQFNLVQLKFLKRNSNSLAVISEGTQLGKNVL